MKSRPKTADVGETFATRLYRERLRQGYSLRDLAKASGGVVSYQTLHNWEAGKTVPRVGKPLQSVALVLRRTVLFLLTGEE